MSIIWKIVLFILTFCIAKVSDSSDYNKVTIRTLGFPPYGIEGSPQSGFYYDLANKVVTRAGYTPENDIQPYARIIKGLKANHVDMTIMFEYEDLKKHVAYIAPIPTLQIVIMGKKGKKFEAIRDLKGKTLAYLRGANFRSGLENDPEVNIYEITDFPQGVRMLSLERVDAIIGPSDPIIGAAYQLGIPQNFFGKPLIVSEKTPWIQISNGSLDRIDMDKIKKSYQSIIDDGSFKKLRLKYLGTVE